MLPAVSESQTLDAYLHTAFPEMDRAKVRALLGDGRVSVNGEVAEDGAHALDAGDRVRIRGIRELMRRDASARGPGDGMQARAKPVPMMAIHGVRAVYHDDDIIVVDKPPGMLTASPTPVREKTLLDVVKELARGWRGSKRKQPVRVGVIHRLDREASGLVVFSLSQRGYDWLKEDFRARRAHRVYLALVEGNLGPKDKTGTIQSFLAEDATGRVGSVAESIAQREAPPPRAPRGRAPRGGGGEGRGMPQRMGDDDTGPRLAITHYRVMGSDNNRTLVQVRLETGRKHQIRVHMAEQGHPIVGDDRYGARTNVLGRLGLHAAELGVVHPSTGRQLRFSAPGAARFWEAVGMEPPANAVAAPEPGNVFPGAKHRPMDTSWEGVAQWYDKLIDDAGSDQYERVIMPGTLRLLEPREGQRILDVACGQGVLSRRLAELGAAVVGVDAAASLVEAAQRRAGRGEKYIVGDARDLGPLGLEGFDAAACVMALSNMDSVEPVCRGVAGVLKPGGCFVFVIVHPAFRAAGQTGWGWDPKEGKQYRRVDGYLSPGHKRIQMHPGADPSIVTHTFHRPIQSYVKALADAGMVVAGLEEWPAQRVSTSGPRAQEENRARREIPMFLGIRAIKSPER